MACKDQEDFYQVVTKINEDFGDTKTLINVINQSSLIIKQADIDFYRALAH